MRAAARDSPARPSPTMPDAEPGGTAQLVLGPAPRLPAAKRRTRLVAEQRRRGRRGAARTSGERAAVGEDLARARGARPGRRASVSRSSAAARPPLLLPGPPKGASLYGRPPACQGPTRRRVSASGHSGVPPPGHRGRRRAAPRAGIPHVPRSAARASGGTPLAFGQRRQLRFQPGLRRTFMVSVLPLLVVLLAPSASQTAASAEEELGFGIEVARRGLWSEARFRFERAVALDPDNAAALNNLGVALEQQGEFAKARETFEKALKLKPGNLYIQQNYDLFREADDKRNRKKKPTATPTPLRLRHLLPLHSLASPRSCAGGGLRQLRRGAGGDAAPVEDRRVALPARAGGGLRHRPRRERRGARLRDLAPAAEPAALQHPAAGAGAGPPAPAATRSSRPSRSWARAASTPSRRGSSTGWRRTGSSRTPSTGARWARSSRTR